MVLFLRLHFRRVRAMAFHFHLRPGSVILQLVVPLVTVKAGSPVAFPSLAKAMEKESRPVVAAVSFVARSAPEVARFAFGLCCWPICFAIAGLVIAAPAGPFSLAGPDLAAAVVVGSAGFAGFAAGSAVAAVGLSAAVDSAATVFAAAGPGFAVVAADLACSAGSVCSFAATGKGRAVVAISGSLIPRSSF